MPHIDDGTLHALLDGALRAMEPGRAAVVTAHLEACAECRARAEEAAALRARTDEILGVLEPAVVPDFAEVLVRAGAGAGAGVQGAPGGGDPTASLDGDRLRARLRWTRGLAWAATLVIALGTGYLIRDRMVPEPGATTTMMRSAADRAAGSDDRGASAPTAAAEPGVESEDEQTTRAAAPPPPPQRREIAAEDATIPPTQVAERESGERQAADEGVPDPRIEVAGAARDAADASPAGPAAGFLAAATDGAGGFEEVAPEDVFDVVGAPLMVLPGAGVTRTMVGGTGPDRVVVSLQRLQEGVVIRVTQRPVDIALESIVVTGVPAGDSVAAPAPAAPVSADRMAARRRAAEPSPAAADPLRMSRPEADAAAATANTVTVSAGLIGWELVLEGPLPWEALEALGKAAAPHGTRP